MGHYLCVKLGCEVLHYRKEIIKHPEFFRINNKIESNLSKILAKFTLLAILQNCKIKDIIGQYP